MEYSPDAKLRLLDPDYDRELGDEFIANMAPELRAGSIAFYNNSEWWIYIGISLGSAIFFFVSFFFY